MGQSAAEGHWGPRIETDPYFTSSPFEPTLPPVTSLEEIDVTDPELYLRGDPHATWRIMRQKAPVYWHKNAVAKGYKDQNFWCVTTYEGASQVLGDAATFSNAVGPFVDMTAVEAGIGDNIFTAEGEYHRVWRKAILHATSGRSLQRSAAAVEACIRWTAEECTDGDILDAAKMAHVITPRLIAAFFCLEGDEAAVIDQYYYWDSAKPGRKEFIYNSFENILAARRSNPKHDIYTTFTEDEDRGLLTHEQAVKYAVAMVGASFAGLKSAVHNPLLTLVHHPDQFAVLREHPEYIENGLAVEEILRWAGHSMHLARMSVKDTEILGQKIKAGEVVVSFNTSANRDETVFEDPYTLDVSRKRRRIFTFSTGPHQCLGQMPTRRTVQALLRYLVKHFKSLEKVGPLERLRTPSVLGSTISTLKIRVTRDSVSSSA
ncbi:hypothetical protein H2204_010274 [Knufia peltigerae]|uniref:Cytochrome P450 n=1 Tax=Knufia peltigerae TaxID=1002370 RepID=A0AA38XXF4_9EURO|nr:hypothetical protein H2204_010274 [Knufia peltigerae]